MNWLFLFWFIVNIENGIIELVIIILLLLFLVIKLGFLKGLCFIMCGIVCVSFFIWLYCNILDLDFFFIKLSIYIFINKFFVKWE